MAARLVDLLTPSPARDRPQVLSDETKTIAVRVSAATYTDLKKRAGQRMAETGESCSVSEIVRFAIENELTKS